MHVNLYMSLADILFHENFGIPMVLMHELSKKSDKIFRQANSLMHEFVTPQTRAFAKDAILH